MGSPNKANALVSNEVGHLGTDNERQSLYDDKSPARDIIDEKLPEGVQRIDAITAVWSKRSLIAAYIGSVCRLGPLSSNLLENLYP